jgi:hypothetical protein
MFSRDESLARRPRTPDPCVVRPLGHASPQPQRSPGACCLILVKQRSPPDHIPMPLHAPDAVLLEIGRIAVWFSRIERQLVILLDEFAQLVEDETAIPSGFHKLAERTDTVLRKQFGEQHPYHERFKEFRVQMDSLVKERNAAVHSLWSFGPSFDSSTAVRIETESRHKQMPPEATVVSTEHLRDLVARLEGLDWEISDLRVRICHYEVDSWRGRA